MIRKYLVSLFLVVVLTGVVSAQDKGTAPKLPLERGTDSAKLLKVEDLWQRRIEALRAVDGSIEAQKTIVETLERAYKSRGEKIYLWNALYYQARVLNDRVQLSGEAISTLQSLLQVLQQVPADKAGVLLERKMADIEAQLQAQQRLYQNSKGLARERATQSYVELYAAKKQFRALRADLEAGDAAIRGRSKVIDAEIQALTDRIKRDGIAKGLIEARLPVLAVQQDIDDVRRVLGVVQGYSKKLSGEIPSVLSPSNEVKEEALRELNKTKPIPTDNHNNQETK